MTKRQIFEKPMYCSTGIYGPHVDPVLPSFAAGLNWLRSLGIIVERFNFSQNSAEFVKNDVVKELLRGLYFCQWQIDPPTGRNGLEQLLGSPVNHDGGNFS